MPSGARAWHVRAAAAAACAAATLLLAASGLFEGWELATFDQRVALRFRLGPPSQAADRIALVVVDETSLRQIGRWPWPLEVHARLLRRLAAARSAAVGLDLILSEAPEQGSGELAQAAGELARSTGLFLPCGAEAPRPGLLPDAGGDGSIRFPIDPDGRVRRLPAGGHPPPLVVAMAQHAGVTGRDPAAVALRDGPGGDVIWLDVRRPPVLKLPAGPESLFTAYSYAAVLDGDVPSRALEDRLVLVGVTAPGVSDADRHLTALETIGPVPGVILQANALRALLEPDRVRRPRSWSLGVTALLVGFAVAGHVSRRQRRPGPAGLPLGAPRPPARRPPAGRAMGPALAAGTPLLLLGGYTTAAVVLFVLRGIWVEVVPAAVALIGAQLAFGADELVRERRRRAEIEATFGRYVSRAVLDALLTSPEATRVGGERRQVTVLIADLCRFTPLAEREPPERVVRLLNEYLEALAGPVLDAGGTLDKYLGDGLLAVFGAPLPQPDHAGRALAAAREILRRVAALNESRRGRKEPVLAVRSAVHTGEAVVGNIGTAERVEYTAVGDSVNVCHRLLAEARPGEIVVTADTLSAATAAGPEEPGRPAGGEGREWRGPQTVHLRGRRGQVQVFRLV